VERLTFGEYEVLQQPDGSPAVLGEGTSGTTYKGVLREEVFGQVLETFVAIKVIKPGRLDSHGKRGQFFRELKVLSLVSHPNVVRYLRQGKASSPEGGDQIWYAMEFCGGGNLEEYARRRGGIPEGELVDLALQAAAGLRAVHEVNFAHCDVKPSNLLLDQPPGRKSAVVKLSDFGSVQELQNVTATGIAETSLSGEAFRGSPLFASPEQIKEHRLDQRSDAYSLAITLWYLLLGDRPFVGGLPEVHQWHLGPEPHEPFLPSFLQPDLRRLLSDMLEKDPSHRVGGMDEVEERLQAVREALSGAPVVVAPPPASPLRVEDCYRVDYGRRESNPLGNRFPAVQFATGHILDILFVHPDQAERPQVSSYLRQVVQDLGAGDVPCPVARPRQVDRFGDDLVVVAQHLGQLTLQDVVVARGGVLPFDEAVVFLAQVARAADYLSRHQITGFSLRMNELHLRLLGPGGETMPESQAGRLDGRVAHDPGVYPRVLVDPLHHLPPGPGRQNPVRTSVTIDASGTVTGTIRTDETHSGGADPQLAFVALLYRIVVGHEVPEAAFLTTSAFTPTQRLGDQSNVLMREVLARTFQPLPGCLQILAEICDQEGIPVPDDPGLTPVDRTVPVAPEASLLPGQPGLVVSPFGSERTFPIPGPDWIGGQEVRCPETGEAMRLPAALPPLVAALVDGCPGKVATPYVQPPAVFELTDHNDWVAGKVVRCPYTGRSILLPAELPEWVTGPPEEIARVDPAKPGIAFSPHDPSGSGIAVAPADWEPRKVVRCPATGRAMALPADLPLLVATVEPGGRGRVRSPFADADVAVPAVDWAPGGVVRCPVSGRRFRLPAQLPELEGIADPSFPGTVRSPYVPSGERVTVAPDQWKPGVVLHCPTTGRAFVLGTDLPPLEAILAPGPPGFIISPFDAQRRVCPVAGPEWKPGGPVRCPVTGQPLTLPPLLPPLVATAGASGKRVVRSPYDPAGGEQAVAPEDWRPGKLVRCPVTQRDLLMPVDLPVLEAEAAAGHPGQVVSPYVAGGGATPVPPSAWVDGAMVRCPTSGLTMRLPARLPPLEAIADASVPGTVRSPYAPDGKTIVVLPDQWAPGTAVVCPATGKPLVLPADLPPLPALLVPHQTTSVRSPYDPKGREVPVAPEDWFPGKLLACPATGRSMVLPADLPMVEGRTDAARGGFVHSPFADHEVAVAAADWHPGGVVRCPVSGRAFRLPEHLPPLDGLTDELFPGTVRSPYVVGGERIPVPPERWRPGESFSCPATGRLFRLPPDLPALEAILVEDRPGFVRSPFDRHQHAHPVPGVDWSPGVKVKCPASGRMLVLPPSLPPLCARMGEGARRVVHSPYDPDNRELPVAPEDWRPGRLVRCPVTGRAMVMPTGLPVLEAEVVAKHPGHVVSPYLSRDNEVVVQAADWSGGSVVKCPRSGLDMRLPADLPALEALLDPDQPGVVRSPYAPEGAPVRLPPSEWVAGGKLVCAATGRPLGLPADLPALHAEVVPDRPGWVRSPYDPKRTEFAVPAADWIPGRIVPCPATGRGIALPRDLPLLEGTVDPLRRGVARSPYAAVTVEVAPSDWVAGGVVRCPRTGQAFRLPAGIPPLDGLVGDDSPGTVRSPYVPTGERFAVKPSDWQPGAILVCPATGRPLRLPDVLPHLVAVPVRGRPGFATSPFDPKHRPFPVAGPDWVGSKRIVCPFTGRSLVLPAHLPPLEAVVADDGRRVMRSPYDPDGKDLPVAPEDWRPRRALVCPVSGRELAMPGKLPVLVAAVPPARRGCLVSPYVSGEVEFPVAPADWTPGALVACPRSGMKMRLPDELPPLEAVVDESFPGTMRSPYAPGNEPVVVPPAQWAPGGVIRCPATGRPLVLPDPLPPLTAMPTGRPGFVRSPYAPNHEPIHVPGPAWVAGAAVRCPASGRPLVLPSSLPPMLAVVADGEGRVVRSPYDPSGQTLSVSAEDWRPSRVWACPLTGRAMAMPEKLPTLPAVVDPSLPGRVRSPYATTANAIEVPPAQWEGGATVTCPASGLAMRLPDDLPALAAMVDPSRPGFATTPFAPAADAFPVSAEEWFAGATLACPTTGRPLVLPPGLPVLAALVDPLRPGWIAHPVRPDHWIPVPRAKWQADGLAAYGTKGAVLQLPVELAALPMRRSIKIILFVLVVAAVLAAAAAAAWFLWGPKPPVAARLEFRDGRPWVVSDQPARAIPVSWHDYAAAFHDHPGSVVAGWADPASREAGDHLVFNVMVGLARPAPPAGKMVGVARDGDGRLVVRLASPFDPAAPASEIAADRWVRPDQPTVPCRATGLVFPLPPAADRDGFLQLPAAAGAVPLLVVRPWAADAPALLPVPVTDLRDAVGRRTARITGRDGHGYWLDPGLTEPALAATFDRPEAWRGMLAPEEFTRFVTAVLVPEWDKLDLAALKTVGVRGRSFAEFLALLDADQPEVCAFLAAKAALVPDPPGDVAFLAELGQILSHAAAQPNSDANVRFQAARLGFHLVGGRFDTVSRERMLTCLAESDAAKREPARAWCANHMVAGVKDGVAFVLVDPLRGGDVRVPPEEWSALAGKPHPVHPFRLPPADVLPPPLVSLADVVFPADKTEVEIADPFRSGGRLVLSWADWRTLRDGGVVRPAGSAGPFKLDLAAPGPSWDREVPLGLLADGGTLCGLIVSDPCGPAGQGGGGPFVSIKAANWQGGAVINHPTLKAGGEPVRLRLPGQGLPPLTTAEPLVPYRIIVPYTGEEIEVAASQWAPGARVAWPGVPGKQYPGELVLPPRMVFPAETTDNTAVRVEFRITMGTKVVTFQVAIGDYFPGKTVEAAGQQAILPDVLPPLVLPAEEASAEGDSMIVRAHGQIRKIPGREFNRLLARGWTDWDVQGVKVRVTLAGLPRWAATPPLDPALATTFDTRSGLHMVWESGSWKGDKEFKTPAEMQEAMDSLRGDTEIQKRTRVGFRLVPGADNRIQLRR